MIRTHYEKFCISIEEDIKFKIFLLEQYFERSGKDLLTPGQKDSIKKAIFWAFDQIYKQFEYEFTKSHIGFFFSFEIKPDLDIIIKITFYKDWKFRMLYYLYDIYYNCHVDFSIYNRKDCFEGKSSINNALEHLRKKIETIYELNPKLK